MANVTVRLYPFKMSTIVVALVLCCIFSLQTISAQDNSTITTTNSMDNNTPVMNATGAEVDYGQDCSTPMTCQADLICNNNKCGCNDTDYYDSSSATDKCKPKVDYGQDCSTPMTCQADLICNNNKCGCNDTDYYDSSSSTDKCKPKVNYSESCDGISSPVNVCKDQNTVCTTYTSARKKCLCDNTSYITDDNNCISVNFLMVQVAVQSRTTHFIVFNWTDTSKRQNISYTITGNKHYVNLTKTGVNVTDLMPGKEYNLSVISTLPPDSNYPSIVQQTRNLLWTYPAKPLSVLGQILTTNSTERPFEYKVSFGQPEGNVAYCSVIIIDSLNITADGCTKNSSSLFPLIVSCILTPGRHYNYTLKCYNGNSAPDESEPMTGSFQTQSIGSGPVDNLRYADVQKYSANITWQPPAYPNGVIIGYLVQVKVQESGVCLYNLKVPCQRCVQQQILDVNDTTCSKTETEAVSYTNGYNLELSRLKPYHNYTVIVRAVNEEALGTVNSTNFTTVDEVANNILIVSSSSTTDEKSHQVNLNISWTPGEYTGNTTYYIFVQKETDLDTSVYVESSQHYVTDYYITTFVVNNVLAYWNYKILVLAGTNKGNSSSFTEKQIKTARNRPGVVQNLKVVQDSIVARKLNITFMCPDEQNRNGTINKFVISQTLLGPGNVTNYTKLIETSACKSLYIFTNVTGIMVDQNYNISILTVNDYSEGEFGTPEHVYIQARVPLLKTYQEKLIQKSDKSDNEETQFSVQVCAKCLLDDSQGRVTNVGLLVCVKGQSCTESAGRKRRAIGTNYTKYTTWGQAKIKDFTVAYRTTPDEWIDTLRAGNDISTFVIGGNTSCSGALVYCNGPLREGTEYKIKAIACTDAGCDVYGDDDQVFVTRSPEETPVGAIVGGVLGGLGLVALICVLIFLILLITRRRKRNPTRRSTMREMDNRIKQQRPVKMRDFNEHVLRFHKDSNLLFQDEFENIQNLSRNFKTSCNEAQRESNRVKNRYVDILPFDHSRVKLDVLPDDDDTNDFINANYIRGYNSVREYIATQGPMFCTIPDFWRMVWEQKCKLIIMLSDLMEGGKRKVDLYWPENLNEPINFGTVVVEMTNFSQLSRYIIRNFKVTKGEETRKLTHYFLPGWSDFSADVGFDVIQGFVKVVRQEATPANPGPIIVHCSAGVGRTGTLIAIDYFTQFVEKHSLDDELDIFDFVVQMRKNRTRMVQVESQYIFIYDVINKVIQKKIKDEEEKLYENSSNGMYANMGQPEENIYENTALKDDKYVYSNQGFEPDISNFENEKPTTEL